MKLGAKTYLLSSSDEPPTTEEVRITSVSNAAHNDWKYRSFMKVFATTAEFVGASDSETRDTIIRGQRNYRLAVFSEGRRGVKPYLVRMPAILIDGKPSALPTSGLRKRSNRYADIAPIDPLA
ncbi:MAG: hypothetical protein IPL58_15600 [Betaproteobacteria bacterium]|uniref:Uncharacterized protein n=1 Tax=Candidatus Proximibacter danicus TaxID=2954365 RepID=A0A9D7K405_9PROT|nr:hypothetical protein [Candidatus Proximibacter danicus]